MKCNGMPLKIVWNFFRQTCTRICKNDPCRIDYINGSDTLPPPLTREEEADVFLALEAQDPAAKETLIVHNLRLVVYIAKKFESTGVGLEDLISIGTINQSRQYLLSHQKD